jgi:hypothetical protein
LEGKSGPDSARRAEKSRHLMVNKDKTTLLRRNTIGGRPNATRAIVLK